MIQSRGYRGGEFTSREFNEFCDQAGIKRHLSALYVEAVRHSTYILNLVATRVLKDVTPYEAYRGSKPNLSHM